MTQSLRLADGRQLGFRQLGDPDGPGLFFFHGTPGSRLAFTPDDVLVRSLGARLVLPDRPGYGISDPKPDRTLLDWPDDVGELADHLGIESFAVGGESGGGPHALACAHGLPRRVTKVLLLSAPSPAHFKGATDGMCFGNRLGLTLTRFAPWLLRWLTRRFAATLQKDPEGFVQAMAAQMSAPDKKLFEEETFREAFLQDMREAYRQGAEGHVSDAPLALAGQGWGFDLSSISVPVFSWRGDEDVVVTRNMAEYLARELPLATSYVIPEAGHILSEHPQVIRQMREALHGGGD